MIFELAKLFRREKIFSGNDAIVAQPFGFDLQATAAHTHAAPEHFLTVTAEQPVDEHLGGIGMWLIFENGQMTVTAADIEAVADLRELIVKGQFVRTANERNCKYCDYVEACGGSVNQQAEEKLSDARLADYQRLTEHD